MYQGFDITLSGVSHRKQTGTITRLKLLNNTLEQTNTSFSVQNHSSGMYKRIQEPVDRKPAKLNYSHPAFGFWQWGEHALILIVKRKMKKSEEKMLRKVF